MTTGRRLVLLFLAAVVLTVVGSIGLTLAWPLAQPMLYLGIAVQLIAFLAFLWWMSGRRDRRL